MMRGTLHSYVLRSAAADGEAAAVFAGGRIWSYRQLRAAQQGVQAFLTTPQPPGLPQRTIGVLGERGFTAYASLLGIMASGNIYVPLNPRAPDERLLAIIADAGMRVLVIDASIVARAAKLLGRCSEQLTVLICGTADVPPALAELGRHDVHALQCPSEHDVDEPQCAPEVARPDDCAYLLFTSGTTGRPKGVPVTHANATACIEAVSKLFPLGATDRVAQFSELTFDVSIAEMFIAWKAGASVYAPSFADLMAASEYVHRHRLTVWSSVPTLASNLLALGKVSTRLLGSLRLTLFCGEMLPHPLAAAWQAGAAQSAVVNLYGPTEAAIFSTWHLFDPSSTQEAASVPIGRPLEGMVWRTAPPESEFDAGSGGSAPEELLLSGPQVVSGYWNDPDATGRAFVHLPDENGVERVWYRTRDLVTHDPVHGLVFRGRCDHQVKVRGHRVEALEVEAKLREVTGAPHVAVVPVLHDDGRCEDLVAFVSSLLPEQEVKARCRAVLPDYMVPSRVFHLESFPTNSSGKIDHAVLRRRLAAGE